MWLCLDPNACPAGLRHTEEPGRPAGAAGEADRVFALRPVGGATELMSVGQVEIMDEATLEDLKTQVNTYLLVFMFYIIKIYRAVPFIPLLISTCAFSLIFEVFLILLIKCCLLGLLYLFLFKICIVILLLP